MSDIVLEQDRNLVHDILEHHGVKGMHWGVHRDESSGGSDTGRKASLESVRNRTDHKLAKYRNPIDQAYAERRAAKLHGGQARTVKEIKAADKAAKSSAKSDKKNEAADIKWSQKQVSAGNYFKHYNNAAHEMNTHEIDRINNDPRFKDRDMTDESKPVTKAYFKEYADTFSKHMNDSAFKAGDSTSPSGKYKLRFEQSADLQGLPHAYIEEHTVKHADSEDPSALEVPLNFNDLGQITKFLIPQLTHSEEEDQDRALVQDILEHHGVKGMHWGVRKDGSTSSTYVRNSNLRRSATDVKARQAPGKFVRTSGGARQTAADDAVRVAAARQLAKKSTTDSLSTKQLQEAVNRMNLEQQYARLSKQSDRRSRGQRFVQAILRHPQTKEVSKNVVNQVGKKMARKAAKTAVITTL